MDVPSQGRIVHARDREGTRYTAIVVNDLPDEDDEIVILVFARSPDDDEPGYQYVKSTPETPNSSLLFQWEWPKRVP